MALLGLAAACGGDDDSSSSTPGTSSTSPKTAVTVPDGAPTIDQKDLAFKPDKLTVKAGEKVYFKNSETALHTVTIGGRNESGNMKKGDVFVWTPAKPGTYTITCDFHPQMNAKITAE